MASVALHIIDYATTRTESRDIEDWRASGWVYFRQGQYAKVEAMLKRALAEYGETLERPPQYADGHPGTGDDLPSLGQVR